MSSKFKLDPSFKEEWKPIPGFPSSIEVSDKGEVREVIFGDDPKYFKVYPSGNYLVISYKGKQRPVHRLVASAFIANPCGYTLVRHKDGDFHNNDVTNLEWSDRSEIAQKQYRRGESTGIRIRCLENGKVYSTIYAASATTLIPREAIVANADGRTSSCFGLHFEYVDEFEEVPSELVVYRSYKDVVKDSELFDSIDTYRKQLNGV